MYVDSVPYVVVVDKYKIQCRIINLVSNSFLTSLRHCLLNGPLQFFSLILQLSSMQSTTDIDYKNNLFEHPELTRIVGEPSTATLITLQAEIRDNAQSVQSDLGGGEHGHLGLVCTPEAYHSFVPNAPPYVQPSNPGRLVVEEGLSQYQIAQVRNEHAESTRVFREVLGVELETTVLVPGTLPKKIYRGKWQLTSKAKYQLLELWEINLVNSLVILMS